MQMQIEIKRLIQEERWREAIDFILRLPPSSYSKRAESLAAVGDAIIKRNPPGEARDRLLIPIIESLFRLGDTERPGACILALSSSSEATREKFAEAMKRSLRLRQEGLECVNF